MQGLICGGKNDDLWVMNGSNDALTVHKEIVASPLLTSPSLSKSFIFISLFLKTPLYMTIP